ncbi:hypothetical protein DPMN_094539 [Dreissena polymorpha]|uniref:C-type lectin domain-containing protein n=1 Tax=Dreissena polymorpha TaxID=45954 RepID=A0A9D4R3M1_DREPO|nr:hypothetical protein DPMN_094539 [Dreissena polymorpha]
MPTDCTDIIIWLVSGRLAGKQDDSASFWLGASAAEVEGNWVWYTNNHMVDYSSFASVAESQTPEQDCLVLWGDFNMEWADYICGRETHPICEIEYVFFFD